MKYIREWLVRYFSKQNVAGGVAIIVVVVGVVECKHDTKSEKKCQP